MYLYQENSGSVLFFIFHMKPREANDPVEVFAGTLWQTGMVKTMLESEGIESFSRNEIMGTLNPWWTDAGGAGPIAVFVSVQDYERAREIVLEYE